MVSKKSLYTKTGTLLWAIAAIFALLPSWPHIYYRLNSGASQSLANTIASTVNAQTPQDTPLAVIPARLAARQGLTRNPSPYATPSEIRDLTPEISLPPVDPSLPTANGLIIESIGVKGEINEGEDWQNILRKGIWRVPDFATPADQLTNRNTDKPTNWQKPIILAAHRWGYLDWSSGFRKLNSFYSLPKLKEGDKIQIIWELRKFEYEVYSVQTGTEIPEYNADLILYTCQLWNSPVRFFVMANRNN
jgi:sortase (surface protein transpeptidase)